MTDEKNDKKIVRNAKGQFVKGAAPKSPGRPSAAAERQLAELIKATVTPDKVQKAIEKLFSLAMRGNIKAMELYLAYGVGKPAEKLQLSTDDSKELLLVWRDQPEVPPDQAIDTEAELIEDTDGD